MIHWYWALIALAAGGFITSFVEFKLKYNLIDLLKDLFVKEEGKAAAEAAKLKAKL
jgi:hypothetical protein